MRRSQLLLLLGLLSCAVSCRSEPESARRAGAGSTASDSNGEKAPEKKQPDVPIYGPDRNLLPSDDFVAGIRLPRGLTLFREADNLHVYRIQAPIEKVLAYFGPIMITGKVERRGKGAIYRRASVRGAEVNPTKVDVSILEIGARLTRVSITELPPPPAHAPSQEETLRRAQQDWRTLD